MDRPVIWAGHEQDFTRMQTLLRPLCRPSVPAMCRRSTATAAALLSRRCGSHRLTPVQR